MTINIQSLSRRGPLTAAALSALLPAAALAHGPQMQVTNTGNKIVTRDVFQDGPYGESTTPTAARSVYVMPLGASGAEWHARPNGTIDAGTGFATYDSGPGIAYGNGWSFASASSYVTTFPVGSVFSLKFTSGLTRWDGSAFVDAGAAQVQVYRGSAASPTASATSIDGGASAAMPFAAVAAPVAPNPEPHASASYRLLGDGSSASSAVADGIYRVSVQLASSDAGVTASDPFQFVFTKGVSAGDVQSVVASQFASQLAAGQVQVVPEPGSVGAAGLLAMGLLAGRRRRLDGRTTT